MLQFRKSVFHTEDLELSLVTFFFKITFSIQIEMMHRSLYLYSNFVDTLVAGISLLLAMQVKVYSSY